jgi:hypothetical protein
LKKFILLAFLLPACATADNFADIIMPDEFGIGNSFMNGHYDGWGHGNTFENSGRGGSMERWEDGGSIDGNITSAWFVWRLPSFGDKDVSVRKIRENYAYDTYQEPEDSIISVDVDPETGSKSYRFGAGFYGSMLTLITLIGLGAAKLKGVFGGGNSTNSTEEG